MHICLVAVEIFAWGKYGGFGRATRTIGRELVKRGITVSAVVPRRADQGRIENLDGIQVHGVTLSDLLSGGRPYQRLDADIYHSQEPSLGTYLAQHAQPLVPAVFITDVEEQLQAQADAQERFLRINGRHKLACVFVSFAVVRQIFIVRGAFI